MSLTLLLVQLLGLVTLFSILMFYAGINYYKLKLQGLNIKNPPSILFDYFGKNRKQTAALKIIDINSKNNIELINDESKKTENKNSKKTSVQKVTITPRMTIYKTIDEE